MNDPSESWPPLVGDFMLGNPNSPVAVCTLASRSLVPLVGSRPEIAIAGRVWTENVGIERMVQNLVANRRLTILILCGRESRHGVGQTILSLHRDGLDRDSRVIGSQSPEPYLPNLRPDELSRFQRDVRVIDLIGEMDLDKIVECARAAGASVESERAGSDVAGPPGGTGRQVEVIQARSDDRADWRYDAGGFFLIFVDRQAATIHAEHHAQDRTLLRVVVGRTAEEICHTLVRLGLVTELAHAAYLGREIERAEAALRLGLRYEQDTPIDRPSAAH